MPSLLAGMVTNFEISVIALAARAGARPAAGRCCASAAAVPAPASPASVIALMRAAPTFVVMFFLLNVVPRDASLFGVKLALSGVMTVAVSLVPYSAAYTADAGVEALRQLRARLAARRAAVPAQHHPRLLRDRDVVGRRRRDRRAGGHLGHPAPGGAAAGARRPAGLFAIGIVLFGVPLQLGFAVMSFIQRRLSRIVVRRPADAA